MRRLLHKELRLWVSPITWIFLLGTLMTMIPGYPILVGTFFVNFGIFQSFQLGRESNDVLYTVLLPVQKRDFVKAKYAVVCLIQMLAFLIICVLTVLRMTVLSNVSAYVTNPLMNATPLYLGFVLLIDAAFHLFFMGGFFRTAYKIGLPFLFFGIATLLLVTIGEMLHFFPATSFFNVTTGERMGLQLGILVICAIVYVLTVLLSCKASMKKFERIDL